MGEAATAAAVAVVGCVLIIHDDGFRWVDYSLLSCTTPPSLPPLLGVTIKKSCLRFFSVFLFGAKPFVFAVKISGSRFGVLWLLRLPVLRLIHLG